MILTIFFKELILENNLSAYFSRKPSCYPFRSCLSRYFSNSYRYFFVNSSMDCTAKSRSSNSCSNSVTDSCMIFLMIPAEVHTEIILGIAPGILPSIPQEIPPCIPPKMPLRLSPLILLAISTEIFVQELQIS